MGRQEPRPEDGVLIMEIWGTHGAGCHDILFSTPPGVSYPTCLNKTPHSGGPPRLLPIAGGGDQTLFSTPLRGVSNPTCLHRTRRLRPPSSVAPHHHSAQPGGIPTGLGRNKCVWLCSKLLTPRGTDAVYKYLPRNSFVDLLFR